MGSKWSFETKYNIGDVVKWSNEYGEQYGIIESVAVVATHYQEDHILTYNIRQGTNPFQFKEDEIDCLMVERRE